MFASLLRAISGRCPVHDRASPYRIAELEAATGIDPDAPAKHQATAADLVEAFANPNLIGCGRPSCTRR